MSNPFSMARQFMKLGEDQNLDEGELQVLYNSGHLSRLFRAAKYGDLSRVNVEELERILGLDPSVFKVLMGGPENTDQITAALGFPFNEWINQKNFPLKPSKVPWEDEIEIVDPDRNFGLDECPKILSAAGLLEPIYEHGIRFAQQHGKTTTSTKKPFVIFPHKPWRVPDRRLRVVSLDRNPGSRGLFLHYPGNGFSDLCVLAGVRPRKQPSVS